jgi:hypothetical protein
MKQQLSGALSDAFSGNARLHVDTVEQWAQLHFQVQAHASAMLEL